MIKDQFKMTAIYLKKCYNVWLSLSPACEDMLRSNYNFRLTCFLEHVSSWKSPRIEFGCTTQRGVHMALWNELLLTVS